MTTMDDRSQAPSGSANTKRPGQGLPAATRTRGRDEAAPSAGRPRPVSPNIQRYAPQLTSVLSIANRITGILLSVAAVILVVWLVAAASGPQAFAAVQGAISSWGGQVVLFGFTFAFFFHLCAGIRHLVWDTVHAFELRSIYLGGWMALGASVVLTLAAWLASAFAMG